MRARVSDLYPEDVVLGRGRHGLLHAFVQLLLHRQVPGDGPPDLGADVMQSPQARLCTAETACSCCRRGIPLPSAGPGKMPPSSECACAYLQREGSFGGHLGHQPLFFPLLELAEILLDEKGGVELPHRHLVVCKKVMKL